MDTWSSLEEATSAAQNKADYSKEPMYVVEHGLNYAITNFLPGSIQWKRNKFHWVKTVKPRS